MQNLITGLKYRPTRLGVSTEEELLEVFAELKEIYSNLSQTFEISIPGVRSIYNFKDFLEHSVYHGLVNIIGSGNIGEFVVKNAVIDYDFSSISDMTHGWDKYCAADSTRDGALLKNSKGKAARSLGELILEADA